MMHKNRPHNVAPEACLAILVGKLAEHTWTMCSGFSWKSLTLLNDSMGPEGAQEYTVLRDGKEIESLTVSWYDPAELETALRNLDAFGAVKPEYVETMGPGRLVELIPHPSPGEYCPHCS